MNLNIEPLMDAINRYLAKADEDLEEQLADEGFVAPSIAVTAIDEIEEAVATALNANTDELLESLAKSADIDDFIEKVWPTIKDVETLESVLKEGFRKQFNDLFRQCTYEWIARQDEELAVAITDARITKPAENFIKSWSNDLAGIMKLNTNQQIENILLKAAEEKHTIAQVEDAIANSSIRNVGYRSRRVAVTEVLRVESYSQLESMRQNPSAYKKVWRWNDVGQEPRANHQEINGQEVFKRDTFTLGPYSPLCPRDTSLPASETVNCHCTMDVIQDKQVLGMTTEERLALRNKYMDEVDKEYEDIVAASKGA